MIGSHAEFVLNGSQADLEGHYSARMNKNNLSCGDLIGLTPSSDANSDITSP